MTRSNALAVLMTLGVWLVGFKIIGLIGFFLNLSRSDPNQSLQEFFGYLDPSTDMGFAVQLLLPDELGLTADTGAIGYAALALVIHIVLWFSLAVVVVRRRNFE